MKKSTLLSTLIFFLSIMSAHAKITIEYPESGWRVNDCKSAQYLQEVSYPASSVNTSPDQCDTNLIRASTTDDLPADEPLMLIVNGNPMPFVSTDKLIERPFAFGSGSNSVEIRTSKGDVARQQFYEAATTMVKPDIRIILAWDTNNTDLDLHVITPDGGHCSYENRVLTNGGALDIDVTTGFGPEIFSIAAPPPGAYAIFMNYYGSGMDSDLTVATVNIILHESTIDEKRLTRILPVRRVGEVFHVASFNYP